MVFSFGKSRDVEDAGALDAFNLDLELTCRTLDGGTVVSGSDIVTIVGP